MTRAREPEVLIRELAESDDTALERFHRECFGRTLDGPRHRWLHQSGPCGPALGLAAVHCGGIAAVYSCLPMRVLLDGETVPASLAVGAAVHPDFRRRGLFARMGRIILQRAAAAGHAATFGKPNSHALPGHRRVGFCVLADLPVWRREPQGAPAHACREVAAFDERLDRAFARLSRNLRFAVARDAAWMNWRLSRPGSSYRRLVLEDGDRIAGWLVVKIYRGPRGPVAHIVDLWAEAEDAVEELFAGASALGRECRELNLWVSDRDPRRGTLARLGFLPAGRIRDWWIGCFHREESRRVLQEPGPWLLSYLDNDIH